MIHEFFLIDYEEIPKDKGCFDVPIDNKKIIEVHDDAIRDIEVFFEGFKTFKVSFNNPGEGLDYLGDTIIPTTSVDDFMRNINRAREKNKIPKLQQQLDKLILLCEQAIKQNKYIIHFGL